MKRLFWFLFVVCFLVLGCDGQKEQLPQSKPLKIGLVGNPSQLSPFFSDANGSCRELMPVFYRGFFDWDDKWRMFPLMAERVPTSANGDIYDVAAGKAKMRINLFSGARWSGGIYLSAKDFIFATQVASYPPIMEDNLWWSERIQNYASTSTYSIEMELSGNDLGFIPHVYPVYERDAKPRMMKDPVKYIYQPWKNQLVSNGPYRLHSAVISGGKITGALLVRNDEYARERAKIELLEISFYADVNQLEAAIEQGLIDVAPNIGAEFAEKIAAGANGRVISVKTPKLYALFPNASSNMFREQKDRQIFYHAIDRKAISEKLSGTEVAQSWLHESHPAFERVFSTEVKAGDESQKRLGSLMERKQVKSLSLCYTGGVSKDFSEEMLKMLPPVDFNLLGDRKDLAEDRYRAVDITVGTISFFPWSDLGAVFHRGDSVVNDAFWNADGNRMICETYANLFDENAKNNLLKSHQSLVASDMAVIPLFFETQHSYVSKEVGGVCPRGFGSLMWNIEFWDWEKQ